MKKRKLGQTGLEVSAVGLGAMPLSIHDRPSEADAVAVIHAALDAGIDFIDTADVYCLDHRDIGHSERLLASALAAWPGRAGVLVATKGGLERPEGAWTANGRPEHLRRACEASLVALGVETIGLYQLHAPDRNVPFEASVGALADLRAEGKILHVGLSNVSVAQIQQARAIVPIASVQNRLNPYDRRPLHDGVLALCDREGIAFLPYSPVGGGHGHGQIAEDQTLRRIAKRHGANPYQIALAWLLALSPVMIPIPGASRVTSAVSSALAADVELVPGDLSELAAAFPSR